MAIEACRHGTKRDMGDKAQVSTGDPIAIYSSIVIS